MGHLLSEGWLETFDISNPSSPRPAGVYHNPNAAPRDLALSGTVAYLPSDGGLETIDVSDPANPTLLGYCGRAGRSVAAVGTTAYVGLT